MFGGSGCWEIMARLIGNALQERGEWGGAGDRVALLEGMELVVYCGVLWWDEMR